MSAETPKKAKRKPRQIVKMTDVFPPVCLKCGSTEVKDKGNIRERMETINIHGIDYTHAKRYYARCAGCGQTRAICERIRRPIPQSGNDV